MMKINRQKKECELTNGPGKLTKALEITNVLDGTSMNSTTLYLENNIKRIPKKIITSPRIGISNKGFWTEAPLRYYVAGNPYVSALKKQEKDKAEETWIEEYKKENT